jgi:GH15 family glucan-1,4-alpha-glucosidase
VNDERIQYQPSTGAYLETGPGGILIHQPLGASDHHGCTPDNPWQALQAGQDLAGTADSGTGDDRVAGFQKDFTLSPGASGWFGVVTAFERFGDEVALVQDVTDAYGTATADQVLEEALDAWEDWRNPAPASLSPAERLVWRQSEAVLRQGQVWEGSDSSHGQILASLPPGNWNICWMRDMAYAIVALVRAGHLAEARAALEFVLEADSGLYELDYVGVPYQVTITRYFGRGKEETDFNEDGPNIEFDGFGLYLWAL